jgi:pilus assembly protein CpaE
MNTSSPLLIIALSQDEVPALVELAKGIGYADPHLCTGTFAEAIRALDNRQQAPEFILIDIGSHSKDVLPELDELAAHCEATVNVAVIGSVNDINFYRELKQRGILEYFPRPVQPSDVSGAFIAVQQKNKGGSSSRGTVIATMSAASGDGSSTLAMNLAYCFAIEHKQPTVLVDMDYQFGLIAKSLDLTAPFGTRELFEHPDRGLDDLLVQKMLVKYADGLNIIAAPNELRLMPSIRPEVIQEMLTILRAKYKFVVVELPHVWTDWTVAVLRNADQIMLVGQLWLRSLTHATRMLTAWQGAGIDLNRVSLVINRSGAKFKEAISAEEFERICHQKIDAHLNNDIKAVVNAENQGKTLVESAQGSLLQQQFKQIAQNLVVQFHGKAAESTAASGKKGLMGMFEKKSGT